MAGADALDPDTRRALAAFVALFPGVDPSSSDPSDQLAVQSFVAWWAMADEAAGRVAAWGEGPASIAAGSRSLVAAIPRDTAEGRRLARAVRDVAEAGASTVAHAARLARALTRARDEMHAVADRAAGG